MNRTTVLRVCLVGAMVVAGGVVASQPVGAQDADTTQGDAASAASVTFENQTIPNATVVNASVTVQSVNLPEGGFVAIYNTNGRFLGASEYLEPGEHENVTVTLFQPLETPQRDRDRARNATLGGAGTQPGTTGPGPGMTGDGPGDRERARDGTGGGPTMQQNATIQQGTTQGTGPGMQIREQNRTRSTTLLAIAHEDSNGNEAFHYVASNGTRDGPSVDGGIVLDDAVVSVE